MTAETFELIFLLNHVKMMITDLLKCHMLLSNK